MQDNPGIFIFLFLALGMASVALARWLYTSRSIRPGYSKRGLYLSIGTILVVGLLPTALMLGGAIFALVN